MYRHVQVWQKSACGCFFNDFPEIHNRNPVGDGFHHSKVVTDEEIGETKLFLQLIQKQKNLRLNRDIQRANRFVEHDDFRFSRQRARNGDTLGLAPENSCGKRFSVSLGI